MNQKQDYNSLRPKGKISLLTIGLFSMFICLGTQFTHANHEAIFKIKVDAIVQSTITGTVLDSDGVPLPGANVVEKGTTNGTQTDFDGNFTLEVTDGATLIVSYLGFVKQEVAVDGQSSISVTLAEDAAALEEVIVTGYQTETKRETTAAVSIVKAEDLAAIPSGNVEQQLQGRVAGVTVLSNGQPGTTSQIRVRGFGSFGGNQPLYVVDGVPVGNTEFVNPDDIETTTVLKDAAAASIYGARAAGGVIVITTKQGKREKQKTKFTVDLLSGVRDPNVAGSPKQLNPQQEAEWTHIAYRNSAAALGEAPNYSHPQYGSNATPTFPDYLLVGGLPGGDQSGVRGDVDLAAVRAAYELDPDNVFLIRPNLAGTNWYKEITRPGPITRATLGIDGGTEDGRFYMGINAYNESGILLENEFARYSARFNSEWDLAPWLSVGENFQVTYRSNKGGFGGGGGVEGGDDESFVLSAYRMPTIIPVRDEFGSFASTRARGYNNPRNPVRQLKSNDSDDKNFSIAGFGNIYALIKPFEGLTFRTSLGGQYLNFYNVNYGFKYLGDSEPQASDSFNEGGGYVFSYTFTNTLTYEKLFGKHKVKALAGIEALNTGKGRNINGSGINPFSTDLNYINLSTVQSPVVNSGLFNGVNFFSVFGKLDYNFDERYYLTGVLRRDGSSRFGANTRYGVFPAVSGAWRVIDESFMENQDFISDFKIRAGWGEMGNSNNVNPDNQYVLFNSARGSTFYPIGGQNSGADEGYRQGQIANPNAQWETSVSTNIGFDLAFFNNKIKIELDWWNKDTEDLLFQVPLAGVTGNDANEPFVNIATMNNTGVDFQIRAIDNITEDFSFDFTFNGSFLKNEITFLADGIDFFEGNNGNSYRGINPPRNAVGQPLSSFFGYEVDGYFNTQGELDEFIAANPGEAGNVALGRFKYRDTNGDGVLTPDDRTFLGNPVPDFTGGVTLNLKYKNLEFETYWFGSYGNEIFNQSRWFRNFFGSFEGAAKGTAALRSWTPELGNNAEAPIWERQSNLYTNGAANSWYVEDGSFIRLQRLALTYSFDSALVDSFGLTKLKLGLSANNIWTATKYTGLDPVVAGADTNFGVDVGNYSSTSSYLISLNIGL